MDRGMLEQRLAEAERHVALGEKHLARQREILQDLRVKGRDILEAERLLTNMEASQRLHIEGRDRIAREIADLNRLER
jgi:hypothetical protein